MTDYTITTLDEPDWVIDADELAVRMRSTWPGARVQVGSVEGSSTALEAILPIAPPDRELGITLSGTGQAAHLEATDAQSVAEFTHWFMRTFLAGKAGVKLIEESSMRLVDVSSETGVDELVEQLSGREWGVR